MKRLIRVLVYEGTDDWIQDVIRMRGVKGSKVISYRGTIKEAIVGDFLEEVVLKVVENQIQEDISG